MPDNNGMHAESPSCYNFTQPDYFGDRVIPNVLLQNLAMLKILSPLSVVLSALWVVWAVIANMPLTSTDAIVLDLKGNAETEMANAFEQAQPSITSSSFTLTTTSYQILTGFPLEYQTIDLDSAFSVIGRSLKPGNIAMNLLVTTFCLVSINYLVHRLRIRLSSLLVLTALIAIFVVVCRWAFKMGAEHFIVIDLPRYIFFLPILLALTKLLVFRVMKYNRTTQCTEDAESVQLAK